MEKLKGRQPLKAWSQILLLTLLIIGLPTTGLTFDLLEGSELHGFIDARGGMRTGDDSYQRDTSLLESRLQLSLIHI